jgi:zinc D-Ala-D-Ala carboxypeptidase
MSRSEPARTAARRIRPSALAAIVLVSATLVSIVTGRLIGPSLASASWDGGGVRRGLSVFDDERPPVAKLDPDLLGALRQAATAAARDGVEITISSGWRSPEHQKRLLRQAVSRYGSKEKAARWVATADTSSHVSGRAVDVGPSRAMAWLSKHGAEYRLCQIYRNEPWHYELRPDATDDGCPPMYANPRYDPRMQQ